MKKYIKQIATFALIATLASCAADDDVDFTSVGGNVVAQASISRLDKNFDLPIKVFTKEGVTASKIEIYKNAAETTADPIILGDKVADATIGANGATFNTSTLGSFDVFPVTHDDGTITLDGKTGSYSLAIVTTYSDGSNSKATYTLAVTKGIVWKVLDEDDLPTTTSATSGVTSVKFMNPDPVNIYYATVTNGTTVVDNVVGEFAKNGSATYTALPPGSFSTTAQTIDVAGIPYTTYGTLVAGDKITYRFTVSAGTQKDVISTTITFADQVFGSAQGGSVANADVTSQFSFATGLNYDGADTKNTEITFVSPFGFKRSSDKVRVLFVKSTLDYDTANLFDAETAFNTGTQVTQLTDLATNDVVLYKITRNVNLGTATKPNFKDVTYYGLIKITDRVEGSTSQKLSFSYKEGELLQATTTPPVVIPTI
jgi:hypothetical protein